MFDFGLEVLIFVENVVDEWLFCEVWIDGYEEDEVEFFEYVGEYVDWGCWVEGDFCFGVSFFDLVDKVICVFVGFLVK